MFDNITEMVSVIIFLNISCYTGYKEQWLLEKRAKENPVLMDGPVLTEHHSEESLRELSPAVQTTGTVLDPHPLRHSGVQAMSDPGASYQPEGQPWRTAL